MRKASHQEARAYHTKMQKARRLGYSEKASAARDGQARRGPRRYPSLKHSPCRLVPPARGCSPLTKPDGAAAVSQPRAEEPGASSLSRASPGYIARESPYRLLVRPRVLFRFINIWHGCRRENTTPITRPAKMRVRQRPCQPRGGCSKPGSGSPCWASR